MSEIQSAKRVVDKTAPWGKPEGLVLGEEDVSWR